MRLLLDEMLPAAVAAALREHGCDAVAVQERADLMGLGEAELLERAHAERRTLVTYDRVDFLRLDGWLRAEDRVHSGIVLLGARRFPPGPATVSSLVSALEAICARGERYPGFVHWLEPPR